MLLNDGHVVDTAAAVDPWNCGKIYFFSFHEEGVSISSHSEDGSLFIKESHCHDELWAIGDSFVRVRYKCSIWGDRVLYIFCGIKNKHMRLLNSKLCLHVGGVGCRLAVVTSLWTGVCNAVGWQLYHQPQSKRRRRRRSKSRAAVEGCQDSIKFGKFSGYLLLPGYSS